MPAVSPLDTIWEVSDELWMIVEPILLAAFPPRKSGRPRADWRPIINGIIYHLRTGCQWNRLPKQFGDDSTVHRWFLKWAESGALEAAWAAMIDKCDELRGVEWKWQSADCRMGKARFGGISSAPIRPIGASLAPRSAC